MRISRWYPICAMLCVLVHSAQYSGTYINRTQVHDLGHASSNGVFDRVPGRLLDFANFKRNLAPSKPANDNFSILSVTLEPDAEMLPAHYTGVKSPGVDHMELKYAESRALERTPETSSLIQVDATLGKYVLDGAGDKRKSSEAATESQEGGHEETGVFEKSSKDDLAKEKLGTEHTEAAGKRKMHSENESSARNRHDRREGEEGGMHVVNDSCKNSEKESGFHDVYHKDENKMIADFYDNEHRGGHFKKHGRHDEKHAANEGTFEKGSNGDSSFDQAKSNKKEISEKTQANREAKGHGARQGYDGFFKNFQGFAKQADRPGG